MWCIDCSCITYGLFLWSNICTGVCHAPSCFHGHKKLWKSVVVVTPHRCSEDCQCHCGWKMIWAKPSSDCLCLITKWVPLICTAVCYHGSHSVKKIHRDQTEWLDHSVQLFIAMCSRISLTCLWVRAYIVFIVAEPGFIIQYDTVQASCNTLV